MRNRIGAAALLSALVVTTVLVAGCDRAATTSPDTPSRPPTTSPASGQTGSVPVTAEQVFRRGDLQSYASRDGVETLTVWELCATRCRRYWVLSGGSGEAVVGDAGAGAIPAVSASRSGYVVKAFGRPGFVVRPDGTTLPLQGATTPRQVNADTVVLPPLRGELTAVDPADGTTWQLTARPGRTSILDTAVTGGGTVWAIPREQGADPRILRLRGERWRSIPVSGDHPRATTQQGIVATGDGPTRIAIAATYGHAVTPPAMLLVSTDAGRTWDRPLDDGLPFALGDSMAIAGDTLFLSGVDGRVWRTVEPGWTRFERVPGLRGVVGLQPAGDRVIGWRWRSSRLVSLDQRGRSHPIAFKRPRATEPTTPPVQHYDVRCLTVAPAMARHLASRAADGVDIIAGMAVAVRSPDLRRTYFVAMQFRVAGVSETQLGVWAIRTSVRLGEQGSIAAVDGPARRFTVWPRAHYSTVDRGKVEFTLGDAKACLLR